MCLFVYSRLYSVCILCETRVYQLMLLCAWFTLQFVQLIATVETVQTSVVNIVNTRRLLAVRDVSVTEHVSLDVRQDGLVTTVIQVHVAITLCATVMYLVFKTTRKEHSDTSAFHVIYSVKN